MKLSPDPDADWLRVVGVAGSVTGLRGSNDEPQVYVPTEYTWGGPAWVVLRAADATGGVPAAVRQVVRDIDPRLVPRDFTTMDALLSDTIALDRFYMLLLASFAGTALLLSVVGLYGVISNAVTQRTPEIGVRLALGATPGEVQRLVLGQGLRLTAVGVAMGILATFALVRLIASALYGIEPYDPVSFVTATVLLVGAAAFAAWLPTRRASRVDPVMALRSE
jgi:ABC-type antimicrobial peptide transport system permease subunit